MKKPVSCLGHSPVDGMAFFRLFAAVRPSAEGLATVGMLQDSLRRQIDSDAVRWIGKPNMHITLQFLGDTPENRVVDVISAMSAGTEDETAHARRPFIACEGTVNRRDLAAERPIELAVGATGAFPNARHPRVVWAGIQDSTGRLGDLQKSISRQLEKCGFKLDPQPFRPHITLGYVRKRATQGALSGITAAVRGTEVRVGARFTVSEVLLVRSVLLPSGAVYSDLHSIALSSASNRTSFGESARE